MLFGKKKEAFPPVPKWKPSIKQPLDRIADRMRYYSNGRMDIAIFQHGTAAILPADLSDDEAERVAKDLLNAIFFAHPDMNPRPMDDGNILVGYGEKVATVVLADIVKANWSLIEREHKNGITPHEVLMTPLGPNLFDDFGKTALFGRCFMFMDAQNPSVAMILRKTT